MHSAHTQGLVRCSSVSLLKWDGSGCMRKYALWEQYSLAGAPFSSPQCCCCSEKHASKSTAKHVPFSPVPAPLCGTLVSGCVRRGAGRERAGAVCGASGGGLSPGMTRRCPVALPLCCCVSGCIATPTWLWHQSESVTTRRAQGVRHLQQGWTPHGTGPAGRLCLEPRVPLSLHRRSCLPRHAPCSHTLSECVVRPRAVLTLSGWPRRALSMQAEYVACSESRAWALTRHSTFCRPTSPCAALHAQWRSAACAGVPPGCELPGRPDGARAREQRRAPAPAPAALGAARRRQRADVHAWRAWRCGRGGPQGAAQRAAAGAEARAARGAGASGGACLARRRRAGRRGGRRGCPGRHS